MNRKNVFAGLYLAACLVIPAFGTTLVTLVCTTLTATTATITRLTVGSLTITTSTATGYTVTNATATVLRASTSTLSVATIANRLILGQSAVGTGNTATTGVYASTTIPVNTPFQTVISSGILVLVTATPSVSTTTAVSGPTPLPGGTLLVLTSTSVVGGHLILQDNGTLSNSLLELGAATRTIDEHNTLVLIFDSTAGKWKEVAFGAL